MGAAEALVVDDQTFFAPADTDMVDSLLGQYQKERQKIEAVGRFIHGDGFGSVIHYFNEGNKGEFRGLRYSPSVEDAFAVEPAIAALNTHYWQRALNLTDVLDFMPTKRREEWFESIHKMETPEFTEETVRATLGALLQQRMQFLAEKVDGIFRALSRTHVTNQPEGFGRRMILQGVTNDWGMYGRTQTGHINDLRQVIAKFQGRDEPDYNASNRMVEIARARFRGEWLEADGGAMRIRCYNNGNAHLEIHPDIAWRLNQILAHLHPTAIPSEFRSKPKRKARAFKLYDRPLPFAVLSLLHELRRSETRVVRASFGRHEEIQPRTKNPNSFEFGYGEKDKHALKEAQRVLEMLGGARMDDHWEFDYDPGDIIKQIVVTGVIPDQKSHQFYPTPKGLAEKAVELAEIGLADLCLEPSAGVGGIADLLPKDRTLCVEINKLHCAVLQSKGFSVEQGDFIAMASELTGVDRIVMNPPFDQGRWRDHVEAALGMVAPGGRLVAILPEGAKGKVEHPGFTTEWHGPFANQFAGASISVAILVAQC